MTSLTSIMSHAYDIVIHKPLLAGLFMSDLSNIKCHFFPFSNTNYAQIHTHIHACTHTCARACRSGGLVLPSIIRLLLCIDELQVGVAKVVIEKLLDFTMDEPIGERYVYHSNNATIHDP